MAPYLVSFFYPTGNIHFPHTYGSHVVDLWGEPMTTRAIWDLESTMGLELGIQGVNIMTWDFLPDENAHPSSGRPYAYHAAYHCHDFGNSTSLGRCTLLRDSAICTLSDLRDAEGDIRRLDNSRREVHMISCKAIREPLPEHLQHYNAGW